jgi:hypothetical protein
MQDRPRAGAARSARGSAALAIASVGIEAVADDAPPVALDVGDDAARLVVIFEKSMYALRMGDAIGLVISRTSMMRTDMTAFLSRGAPATGALLMKLRVSRAREAAPAPYSDDPPQITSC